MNKNNKIKLSLCLRANISLLIGLLIYLLYRPETYVTQFFKNTCGIYITNHSPGIFNPIILKYYFVDFLWLFSFLSFLYAIYLPTVKQSIIYSMVSFGLGTLYEIFQLNSFIVGTGDPVDVLMYLLAALTVNINYIYKEIKTMKNKRILNFALTIAIMFVFCFFAIASGESTETNQGSGTATTSENASNLGKYNVEIKECRLAKDFENKDVVIIKYGFTNNSDNAISFMAALDDQVYQNGIGLTDSFFVEDSAEYNSDDQMKEIQTGATFDLEIAYLLNDNTTDIDVEVKELISFNDNVVKKTFSISQ